MEINHYVLSRQLGKLLSSAGLKIVIAESCTSGGLCHEMTQVPGSSAWVERGFVTYSNESKIDLLGVKAKSIKQYGAVSKQVAQEMALGALKNSDANIAISITGVAGPRGGSFEKPVGTVWFGLIQDNGHCESRQLIFTGGRGHIRGCAIAYALEWLVKILS